ncbi:MAG: ClpX C4-type zinc finger protein [Dehalococcoidia bacterium]
MLTPAEWRVLDLVREGRTNGEIAVRRGISVNTVRTHVASILSKLGVGDRRAAAAWEGRVMISGGAVTYRCSFCGKADEQVELMLAGPKGLYICGACVERCNAIIAEHRAGTG